MSSPSAQLDLKLLLWEMAKRWQHFFMPISGFQGMQSLRETPVHLGFLSSGKPCPEALLVNYQADCILIKLNNFPGV